MTWYITARTGLSQTELNRRLKSIIRKHPFIVKMIDEYDIPIDEIEDQLTFKIKKLRGRHAQGNGRLIYLNEKLFEDGDFFKNNLHFVVHEMVHWFTKQREERCYFADPEEVEAFTFGMMFEMLRGKTKQEILQIFFPIINAHFDGKEKSSIVFNQIYEHACHKLKKYT